MKKPVTIYTDGACLGNPGPGGYASVLIQGRHRKEISGGFRRTTNNRMEIMAAIAALELLKQRCTVRVHTDSRFAQPRLGEAVAIESLEGQGRQAAELGSVGTAPGGVRAT